MKIIRFIKSIVFKKRILPVSEFIKKYHIDGMTEDQMEIKLAEIIYSNAVISRYSKNEKEIAMLLLGNYVQDKGKEKMKLEYYKAMSQFNEKQKELSYFKINS